MKRVRKLYNKKRIGMISLFVFSMLLFTGCKSDTATQNDMKNVEQRDYATILLIADGNDGKNYEFSLGIAKEKRAGEKSQTEDVVSFSANSFEELAKMYQEVKGKDLSLAHLKVILLAGQNGAILEEQWDLFNALDENREIAKTCPVLQMTSKDQFLDYLKDAKEPVGTYLNDLVKVTDGQGKEIPWLKDYLKVLREGTALQVYYLESVPEGWQLKCREVVSS